jgi:hypothetical protein
MTSARAIRISFEELFAAVQLFQYLIVIGAIRAIRIGIGVTLRGGVVVGNKDRARDAPFGKPW